MHVHLIAVAGTGMGAVAGLFQQLGHDVSGSDMRFDPPMGPALRRWGIRLMEGFDPKNLSPTPDLVVIGNVCRSNNVEARAAIDSGMRYTDMAHAIADYVIAQATSVVIAGTHGKTTTTCLCAWLLEQAGLKPGFLIGGLPQNFEHSFRVPTQHPSACPEQPPQQSEVPQQRPRCAPFVVEGDEYDTAFFEKTPKMWHYRAQVAALTSIEHDHIDIYPTLQSYLDAFAQFVRNLPIDGLLVARAGDAQVRAIVGQNARCEVLWYGVEGESFGNVTPQWLVQTVDISPDHQRFDLHVNGKSQGTFTLPMSGLHNVGNAVAAMAIAVHGFGATFDQMRQGLKGFLGVRRRQQLVGTPGSINVYDDFAHHPTAVHLTLQGLRQHHPQGALFAIFEPRSATACRNTHQRDYAYAFEHATHVIIAPVARDNISEQQRLNVSQLVKDLSDQGKWAKNPENIDEIIREVVANAQAGDTVAILSNGAFGGIHQRLIDALSTSQTATENTTTTPHDVT